MNLNFRICGIKCEVVKRDTGDYKMYITQKCKNKCSRIALWFPGDDEFDFFVDELDKIQLKIFEKRVKAYLSKLRRKNEYAIRSSRTIL